MSIVTPVLPPDPEVPSVVAKIETVAKDLEPLASVSPTIKSPTVSLDASGTPHITFPLTSKAKAWVGGVGTLLTGTGAVVAVTLLPQDAAYIGLAVVAVGGILNFLGIHQTTNKQVTK